MEIRRRIYLIYAKIVCTVWAYKLGLNFRELRGVYLALEAMSKKRDNGTKTV